MRWSTRIQLAAIVGLALLWRAAMLIHYKMIDTDAAYYGAVARFFADGNWQRGLDPLWPPFYPLLVSIPFRFGMPLEAAGVTVSLLASTACVVCCYFVAKRIAGPRGGLIAAVVTAVHPRLVTMSQGVLTEALYLFLAAAALALFVHSLRTDDPARESRQSIGIFLTGLATALAFLTKPEGFVFFVLLLAVAVASAVTRLARSREPRHPLSSALPALFLTLGFLIPTAPYLYDISKTEGRLILGEKGGLNFYLTYRPLYREEGIEVQPSDFASITGGGNEPAVGNYRVGKLIRSRPGAVAWRTVRNLTKALLNTIPVLMYGTFMALTMAGLLYRRRVPRSQYEWLFVAWIMAIAISVAPFFLMKRFFVATLPPLIVWCAIGIEELRHHMSVRLFKWTAIAGVVFSCVYTNYSLANKPWPVLYKEAGSWLRANAIQPVIVTGRKPEVSFYAESEFRPLEVQKTEALQGYLRDRGITHLVAEDYIMPSTHPHLAYLIDPAKAPAWLRPVYSATRDGHTLVLYKYE